jgi:hypothetical protein
MTTSTNKKAMPTEADMAKARAMLRAKARSASKKCKGGCGCSSCQACKAKG